MIVDEDVHAGDEDGGEDDGGDADVDDHFPLRRRAYAYTIASSLSLLYMKDICWYIVVTGNSMQFLVSERCRCIR